MAKKKEKVSNERKNLHRLAGEFLVASRLTQRGYMVTLQWGSMISYDILVFDKSGKVAFIEVKSTGSNLGRWVLQAKYANPREDSIPLAHRFVCCVDLTTAPSEPRIYVFPAETIAKGLHYAYAGRFSKSKSYRFALDAKPRGRSKDYTAQTLGEFTEADKYLERFEVLGVGTIAK